MPTKQDDLLLWGHSLAEYQEMFELNQADMGKKILDCASGFGSFNADMHAQGKKVVSADKAYNLSLADLKEYLTTGLNNVLAKVTIDPQKFFWNKKKSFADLQKNYQNMLTTFLADFQVGKNDGRYVAESLPNLSFSDNEFNLALCSYFLFTSENSLPFHLAAIKEMCRVAGECRIYPLVDEKGNPSELLAPVVLTLQQNNYGIEIKQVSYEFQKGSNAMLRVWSQACEV